MLHSNPAHMRIPGVVLVVFLFAFARPGLADDAWELRAPLSVARHGHAVDAVDGIVYVAGGNNRNNEPLSSLEAYDPATDSWSTRASMSTVRTGLAAGVAYGRLYAVGGYNNYYGFILGTVEAYDPATDTWTARATMPTARFKFGLGVVDGILYAVGGNGYGGVLNTVEAYDPLTNTWSAKAPMPTARHSLAVGVVDGILYAVGGNNSGTLATVEAYDPATDTWSTRASMPTGRESLAAGVVSGVLYAIGGYNAGTLTTVEAYDPVSDAWTTKTPMPTSRYNFSAGVISPLIYAVGGNASACCYEILTVLEAYTAPSAPANLPPTAVPGPDQPIHVGQSVLLYGGDSFDDNTASESLEYAWTFEAKPAASLATLVNADTATPGFSVDVVGTYSVRLVVTDESGLSSPPAYVTISSDNIAPTAHAGDAQAAIVGQAVTLDGTASVDPDGDVLTYSWSIVSQPPGSSVVLAGSTTVAPTFVPDVAGEFTLGLVVSDGYADSTRVDVTVSIVTAADYAQNRLADALNYVRALSADQFKAPGHQHALANLLAQAIAALEAGDIAKASMKTNAALLRIDGFPLRGEVDTRGPGMDWIVDPAAQSIVHQALRDALDSIPKSCKRPHRGARHGGTKNERHHGDDHRRHESKHTPQPHSRRDRKH